MAELVQVVYALVSITKLISPLKLGVNDDARATGKTSQKDQLAGKLLH